MNGRDVIESGSRGSLAALIATSAIVVACSTGSQQSGTTAPSTSAQFTVNVTSVSFPSTVVGTTSSTTAPITVTATGNAPLQLTSIVSSNPSEFPLATTCSGPLAPGTTCSVSIQFKPASTGDRSSQVTISTSNADNKTLTLSGTGTPCATLSPMSASVSGDFSRHGFAVMAAGDCTWIVSTTDAWIYGFTPTSGTGSATVVYNVLQNDQTTAPRIGSILVAWTGGSTRFTVNQGGAYCTFQPPFYEPARGDAWILTPGPGCVLNTTGSTDVSWLHADPFTGYDGGLYLHIVVDPNPGGPRTGQITRTGINGNGLYAQYTFDQAGQ